MITAPLPRPRLTLAVLVHRPVHVPPDTVDLHIRLVDEPAATDLLPTRAGSVDQLRSEPLQPPELGDVIHLGPELGEELFLVLVGQGTPQAPADRQQDDVGGHRISTYAEGTCTGGVRRRLRFTALPSRTPSDVRQGYRPRDNTRGPYRSGVFQ